MNNSTFEEVINKNMGNIIVAGMNTTEHALEKFNCSDIICTRVNKPCLIRNIIGEFTVLFNDNNIAVSVIYSVYNQVYQLLRFS